VMSAASSLSRKDLLSIMSGTVASITHGGGPRYRSAVPERKRACEGTELCAHRIGA
jgi:hypothetical protein